MPETYLLCRISQILYSLKAEQGADSGSSIPHAKGRYHATSLQRTSGANVRKFWACIKSSRYWLFQNMYLIFVYPQFSLNICKFYLNMQYAQMIDPVAPHFFLLQISASTMLHCRNICSKLLPHHQCKYSDNSHTTQEVNAKKQQINATIDAAYPRPQTSL